MINFIICFAALVCPNPTHTAQNHGDCNLMHVSSISADTTDTGGETGGIPKPPLPPPPPPPTGL